VAFVAGSCHVDKRRSCLHLCSKWLNNNSLYNNTEQELISKWDSRTLRPVEIWVKPATYDDVGRQCVVAADERKFFGRKNIGKSSCFQQILSAQSFEAIFKKEKQTNISNDVAFAKLFKANDMQTVDLAVQLWFIQCYTCLSMCQIINEACSRIKFVKTLGLQYVLYLLVICI